jgi:hypothetical protein
VVGGHNFLSYHFNFINDGNDFLGLLDGSRNELNYQLSSS